MTKSILTLFFLLHCLNTIQADSIRLKEGKTIRGKILVSSKTALRIRTPKGTVSVNPHDIERIQYDDLFDLDRDQARFLYYERMTQIDQVRERFDLAIFCLEQGLYQEALQEFKKLIPQLPSELDTLKQYITQAENMDFLSLIQKAKWFSQTAHNNEQAYFYLEKAKTLYPDKIHSHQKIMSSIEQGIHNQQATQHAKQNLDHVQSENFSIFLPSHLDSTFWLNFSEKVRKRLFLYLNGKNPLPWEFPCELVIFADKKAYMKASLNIEWSDARSQIILNRKNGKTINVQKRLILCYFQNPEILQSILIHEIGHLVVQDLMGLTAKVPIWLSEGLSNYFMGNDTPLKESSISHLIQFKEEYPSFKLGFYQNASHLVKTLIDLKDLETFLNFTFYLSTGYTFEDAFLLIYPNHRHKLKEWGLTTKTRTLKSDNSL